MSKYGTVKDWQGGVTAGYLRDPEPNGGGGGGGGGDSLLSWASFRTDDLSFPSNASTAVSFETGGGNGDFSSADLTNFVCNREGAYLFHVQFVALAPPGLTNLGHQIGMVVTDQIEVRLRDYRFAYNAATHFVTMSGFVTSNVGDTWRVLFANDCPFARTLSYGTRFAITRVE
jgi:hypothetical protein